ncbi:hypothetical protein [Halomonas halocynthiae]|uniref:hypothetical protein n=1 Tax=Halomonas halocynthiae TaxID=176290 RepID=UPI00042521A5|nr:hypothetical protein [Halomonas halocynthiae]
MDFFSFSVFNASHLEHFVIAMGLQVLLWPVLGRRAAGCFIVAVFLGREIAQHEARGGGANSVGWFYGLLNHWNSDSLLDVFFALLGVLLVIFAVWGVQQLREKERL